MVSIVSTVSQLIDLCVCAHAEGLNLKTMHNHATMHNSVHLHVHTDRLRPCFQFAFASMGKPGEAGELAGKGLGHFEPQFTGP